MEKGKIAVAGAAIAVLSVLITFFVFQTFGWYHLWDTPTPMVLRRLICSVAVIGVVLAGITAVLYRLSTHKENK